MPGKAREAIASAFLASAANTRAGRSGVPAAMWLVAALTFASGMVVAARMTETRKHPAGVAPAGAAPPPCVQPSELGKIPNAVIVDVRSDEEFAAGHIDGALHIPLDSLAARAAEIPKDAVVITACGKGGCRSDGAAMLLRALGHASARPLCGGTMAWLALMKREAST